MGYPDGRRLHYSDRAMTYTEADFEHLSWHDCYLWGVAFRSAQGSGLASELVLDLDFILESIRDADGKASRFRVAPANLVFQEVTDLRVGLDWGTSGFPVSPNPPTIERITRECVPDRVVYPARRYYLWQVGFAWPPGAEIVFKSVGFIQTFRAEPVVSDTRHLAFRQRE